MINFELTSASPIWPI